MTTESIFEAVNRVNMKLMDNYPNPDKYQYHEFIHNFALLKYTGYGFYEDVEFMGVCIYSTEDSGSRKDDETLDDYLLRCMKQVSYQVGMIFDNKKHHDTPEGDYPNW